MKIEINNDNNNEQKDDNSIEINLDEKDISDDVKEQLKETGHAHIHKTGDDGEEVDIDIDKKAKKVEVNIDKDGKKKKVDISLRGIKVESDDGSKNVNIRFLPILLVILAFVFGVLFFFYKVIELVFGSLF